MNLSMVTLSFNPDGGVVFATLSMVTVFLNPNGEVMFATLSMVTVSLNLYGGVVSERFLKAVVNNSNKWD